MTKKKYYVPRRKEVLPISVALQSLFEGRAGQDISLVLSLFDEWEAVVGTSISCLCVPIGHRDTTLQLGAEDSMSIQELKLQAPEILAVINQHLGKEVFTRLSLTLKAEKKSLARTAKTGKKPKSQRVKTLVPPPPPDLLGKGLSAMDPNSPIARCYKAYLDLYNIQST